MENNKNQDYVNALSILKDCKKYIDEKVREFRNDESFPYNHKLLLLREVKSYYHRGAAQTYLVVGRRGLSTCDYCSDGTVFSNDIGTSDKPYLYAYNKSEQKTIELALIIAKNWESIKENVAKLILDHKISSADNSELLATFKIQ